MRAILTYHSIDDSGSVISVDEATLRRQAAWLAGSEVRSVGVEELLALDGDEDAVALTFDDAFANFGAVAWPILEDHGLTATVFVVSSRAGETNAWGGVSEPGIPTLPLMDWATLGRLAEEGVRIGSHTRTHPRLAGLEPARLADELEGSADEIERETGARPGGLAYPYGSVDDEAAAGAARTYDWACTTELAPLGEAGDAHRLPRLDAYYFREAGRLEGWGGARFRARLAVRRALRRARARVREGGVA